MTLEQLMEELRQVSPSNITTETSLKTWLNQAMVELSGQYEFPTLRLRVPAILATNTIDYLYDISDAVHPQGYKYQKRLFLNHQLIS